MNEGNRVIVRHQSGPSVVIAGSHTLIRRALVALLRQSRPGWFCADVDGLPALLARIPEISPRIVLMDLIPSRLEGLAAYRAAFPRTAFVVLSDQDDRATILACLDAGAQGYIPRSADPDQFIRALETILAGGLAVPASFSVMPIHPPAPLDKTPLRPGGSLSLLTDRQRDVFELLAEGCATKTIARRLDLAVGTVKVHLAGIYRTMGASGRLEALAKAHGARNAS